MPSSSLSALQSAPPLSRHGGGVADNIEVLAVGAAFWLSREKTCWVLQTPLYTILDDLAFPCAKDKTNRNDTHRSSRYLAFGFLNSLAILF